MKPHITAILIALLGAVLTTNQSAHAEELPGLGVQSSDYFYTGKPYDEDLESYVFAFRDYDPEINRWTSADPSGFPDGANNNRYVCRPTSEVDLWGLLAINVTDADRNKTESAPYNETAYILSTIVPAEVLGISSVHKGLLEAQFGTTAVSYVGGKLSGTVTVDTFHPFLFLNDLTGQGSIFGVDLNATYQGLAGLRWFQFVDTNDPNQGPYPQLDGGGAMSADSTLYDPPQRPFSDLDTYGIGYVSWRAHSYLFSGDALNGFTVYENGMDWGFQLSVE